MKDLNALLLSAFLALLSLNAAAQSHNLPQPQALDDESAVGSYPPPPRGLVVPIDEGVYFLATAGFLLGIYFSRTKNLKKAL